ncbi:urease accessory protein UreD [Arthrobacter sp. zg-ZUI100]|uniref:urease accessory protein UreD n=1 Tax=Arthrobacter jiangjiafuii TaxID=2817475 RepID=UPI001AEDF383|nr:urease accessory protein UreD [Arthrobacter jiangjiafuii]MBP3037330.1 urease accessory protein UreD [Arthrobacter jiangjiafuii]
MTRSRTLFRTATDAGTATGPAALPARPATTDTALPRPTRISVDQVGGRARFSVLDQGLYLAPRPVSGGSHPLHLRVALIGIHMMLLGGDGVRIQVSVGPGVTLEVVEPAGLVAYDADLVPSRWVLEAELGEGSALIWDGASFVAASGSNVQRETRLRLAAGARALIRETLVLGRSGEAGGRLRSITRVTGEDGDLLYEDLDLTGPREDAVGILGGSRVMASVTAVGWRPDPLPAASGPAASRTQVSGAGHPSRMRRFDLASPGAVARSLDSQAHTAERSTGAAFTAWRAELTG